MRRHRSEDSRHFTFTMLFAVTFIAAVLASFVATPAYAARHTTVAPHIMDKAAGNQAVEVLVLLDDTDEEAAEQSSARGHKLLSRVDKAAYGQRMRDRQTRLGQLKSRVYMEIADPDLETVHEYQVLPVMHLRLGSGRALDKLIRHGKVLSIDENGRNELSMLQSLQLIGQQAAWEDQVAGGNAGAGTSVAVLDTGVDYTRAAFGACSAPATPADSCKVTFTRDFASSDGQLDDHGHGTNVAGIVASVAPSAGLIALDVFRSDGYAYTSDIIAAIDWCVANKATHTIAAINMSLGGGRYQNPVNPNDAWGKAIQKAVDAGIVVAAASGNSAYSNALGLPAAYSNVVSVGAVYDTELGAVRWNTCADAATAADKVTCFSNSAHFLTMLAPGAVINAAGISMAGTSQASPHVAAAAAVLRAAFPDDSVAQIIARLQTGPLVTDTRNGVLKPRLDLAAALTANPPAAQVVPTLQWGTTSLSIAEGAGSMTIPVIRQGDTSGTISVQYAISAGTAASGVDYAPLSGTLSFAEGIDSRNIVIPILDDTLFESDETFSVTLDSPVGATLGTDSVVIATIHDDDTNIEFEADSVAIRENAGNVTLRVERRGDCQSKASVKYAVVSGTALGRKDYVVKSGTLRWSAGDTTALKIVIPIINDVTRESSETFTVNLKSPTRATLGVNKTAVVTITDND